MIKQRNFWMFLLLSIITFGIYSLFFWYQFTEDLNLMCKDDTKPLPNFFIVIILSIITCGIYTFFWYYNLGDKIQRAGNSRGILIPESGSSILLWMLFGSFLCGIGQLIGLYLIIKNFNLLAENY
ncbi:DUF4234 domain-containing protein [Clostridium butyricum]|uniref:DUF4234 domain-containing protein n=1 Tax=Clostridium butyricum TaxID=1492 RepID=UPI00374F3EA3